jgi:hypothetical protein
MKKIFLLFSILSSTFAFAQVDTSFYGLRGYEDLNGNTQLFYQNCSGYSILRMDDFYMGESRNDIFHFDVSNNIDSLFIINGVEYYEPFQATGHTVSDFEFVDSTLTDFYQCGDGVTSFEPSPVVVFNRDYKNNFWVDSFSGATSNLEIVNTDSIINVYVTANYGDVGIFAWNDDSRHYSLVDETENLQMLAINPKNSKMMFVLDEQNQMLKSNDGGATFYIVDSLNLHNYSYYYFTNHINRTFLFDNDDLHIYFVLPENNKNKLYVSNNMGELNSWKIAYESENEIFISHDSKVKGLLYLADGRTIYKSNDFGSTFNKVAKLKNNVLGLYKKPNSDLLYAINSHSLYEISQDSIKKLKSLINYNALSHFPLRIGDIWAYKVIGNYYDIERHPFEINVVRTVTKDTVMNNGIKYFKIVEERSDSEFETNTYQRIDTLESKIYEYSNAHENQNYDLLIYDFSIEIGDTVLSNSDFNSFGSSIYQKDTLIYLFETSADKKIVDSKVYSFWNIVTDIRTFSQNFGLTEKITINDGYDDYWILKGAVLNGDEYGDTTLVGIEENKSDIPTKFALSQNYPNPFNPSTTIKYSIPRSIRRGEHSVSQTTLKVFDILGREVATLVNKQQKAGNYEVIFDASNLSSGVYFYRLQSGSFVETKKIVLLR